MISTTDLSATTLHGSANPHFVIPRGCDFIDVRAKSLSFKRIVIPKPERRVVELLFFLPIRSNGP